MIQAGLVCFKTKLLLEYLLTENTCQDRIALVRHKTFHFTNVSAHWKYFSGGDYSGLTQNTLFYQCICSLKTRGLEKHLSGEITLVRHQTLVRRDYSGSTQKWKMGSEARSAACKVLRTKSLPAFAPETMLCSLILVTDFAERIDNL